MSAEHPHHFEEDPLPPQIKQPGFIKMGKPPEWYAAKQPPSEAKEHSTPPVDMTPSIHPETTHDKALKDAQAEYGALEVQENYFRRVVTGELDDEWRDMEIVQENLRIVQEKMKQLENDFGPELKISKQ